MFWNLRMRRKIIDDYWYLNDLFGIKLIFFSIRVEYCNFLNLSGRHTFSLGVVINNFLLIDAPDRSKISNDQKRSFFAVSLYPLSFFANTPFKPDAKMFRLPRRVLKPTFFINNFSEKWFILKYLRDLKLKYLL